MTLARRMILNTVGLAVSLTALGAVTLWGLMAARRSTEVAREEYVELRLALEVDEHVLAAREALVAGQGVSQVRHEVNAALAALAEFRRFQTTQQRDRNRHEEKEAALLMTIEEDLQEALGGVTPARAEHAADMTSVLSVFGRTQTQIKRLSNEMDEQIARAQTMSDRTIRSMLAVIGSACLFIVAVTVSLNIAQYRSIVVPLQRLAAGARRIAAGRLSERVNVATEGEFAEVGRDFDHMASKLEDLYTTLEERVREKSCELVRSERLASVGYLAAGVAHEINNPLGIITGYAEVTLKRLQRERGGGKGVNTEEAMRIIRDEAFRCKEITDKLLSLAAGHELVRERVQVRHIIDDVVSILGTLPQYRDRRLTAHVDGAEGLEILGNETELRQVIMNLAINALEAVQPKVGEVRFDGRRRNGVVELVVSDNGRGMTGDVLAHVFEPFFTDRNHAPSRGTGLGLSITHAIIEAHGGRIRAESDGPNTGSRFFIELPAADDEEPT